jgi:hypothetical protein
MKVEVEQFELPTMENYAVCLSKPIITAFFSMKGMYVSGTGSTGSRAFPYFLADLAEYVIRFLILIF